MQANKDLFTHGWKYQERSNSNRSRALESQKPPTLFNLRSTFTFIPQIFIEHVACAKCGMVRGARDTQPRSSQASGEAHNEEMQHNVTRATTKPHKAGILLWSPLYANGLGYSREGDKHSVEFAERHWTQTGLILLFKPQANQCERLLTPRFRKWKEQAHVL